MSPRVIAHELLQVVGRAVIPGISSSTIKRGFIPADSRPGKPDAVYDSLQILTCRVAPSSMPEVNRGSRPRIG
jgi:hypothetical protein